MPVVAVSAGGAAAREAAMAAGADFFLDKPMRLADIVDTIRRLADL
jgi:CheY-like chemotaxis protein